MAVKSLRAPNDSNTMKSTLHIFTFYKIFNSIFSFNAYNKLITPMLGIKKLGYDEV